MAHIVFEMLDNGWTDARICEELGMEPDELIRLKYITGGLNCLRMWNIKKLGDKKTNTDKEGVGKRTWK